MQLTESKKSTHVVLRRAKLLLGALLVFGCASPAIPCAATADCRAVGVAPVCANVQTCFCSTSADPDECAYQLRNASGCPCMEKDVRECKMASGAAGISRCVATSGTTTQWGACGSL